MAKNDEYTKTARNIMILGMPTAQISLDYTEINGNVNGKMCRSRVCGHRVEGIDCGGEINEWLSLALGRPNLQLIRQSNSSEFFDKTIPPMSFSSQAQYLLINENSIEWLVERIPKKSDCNRTTILDRFRGNLIVRGAKAFDETLWTSVQIGNNKFKAWKLNQCSTKFICLQLNSKFV